MAAILVSSLLPYDIKTVAEQICDTAVFMQCYERLDDRICTHADMLCHDRGDALIFFEDYYRKNKEAFDFLLQDKKRSIELHKVYNYHDDFGFEKTHDIVQKLKYPQDATLNALRVGDFIFGGIELSPLVKKGANFIFTKQGYAACSCAKVCENAVITSDLGMAKTLKLHGVDVLFVKSGYVKLDGFQSGNDGFIGGASFYVKSQKTLYFFGYVNAHPDFENIKSFANKYGTNIISLSNLNLCDFGGAIVIE